MTAHVRSEQRLYCAADLSHEVHCGLPTRAVTRKAAHDSRVSRHARTGGRGQASTHDCRTEQFGADRTGAVGPKGGRKGLQGRRTSQGAVVCITPDTTTSRRPPGTRMCCFSLDCFPERERRSGERSASADQRRQVKQSRCLLNRQGGRWGLRPMGSRHEAVISMFMCRAHSRFVERAHASQTGRGRGRRPPFLWARSRSCRSRRAVVVCPFLLLLGSST